MSKLRSSLTNRHLWTLAGLAILSGVAYLDFWTGYEIELNLLYALPVVVVTWFAGIRRGLALALLCPVTLLLVRIFAGSAYSYWAYYIVNPLLKFCILGVVAYLGSKQARLYGNSGDGNKSFSKDKPAFYPGLR
jgi:hypothetical protein